MAFSGWCVRGNYQRQPCRVPPTAPRTHDLPLGSAQPHTPFHRCFPVLLLPSPVCPQQQAQHGQPVLGVGFRNVRQDACHTERLPTRRTRYMVFIPLLLFPFLVITLKLLQTQFDSPLWWYWLPAARVIPSHEFIRGFCHRRSSRLKLHTRSVFAPGTSVIPTAFPVQPPFPAPP
ncbi:unnamed protein product [Trypanosoma congolense IL3000]|uniref:WGS project CAEQ00000000 data, annotated contig 2141 n=1 Tax=Trypanosoma congolense (strain IL3000) TaxID=1068625 RepID=F9WBS0_TRYCI|nr:unnamed protein product [Trypanosoma congolense IL3000]